MNCKQTSSVKNWAKSKQCSGYLNVVLTIAQYNHCIGYHLILRYLGVEHGTVVASNVGTFSVLCASNMYSSIWDQKYTFFFFLSFSEMIISVQKLSRWFCARYVMGKTMPEFQKAGDIKVSGSVGLKVVRPKDGATLAIL